jgi:hypothetical protein
VPSAAPGAWSSSQAGAWGGTGTLAAAPAARSSFAAPLPVSAAAPAAPGGRKGASLAEGDLAAREAAVAKRERELRALQLQLRSAPGGAKTVKNWPRFCPCVHHDIEGEIPAAMQGVVRAGYYAYVGLVVCLLWNFVGCAATLIVHAKIAPFLWGALYLMGIPGGWWLWYGRLYQGAIKDSAFAYGTFFLTFIPAHLVFVGWSAIAPPILNSDSHTGFWVAISSVFGDNTGVGIIYFIGAGLWALEFVWSFWTLKRVYSAFRGQGTTMADVKADAARRAVASAV